MTVVWTSVILLGCGGDNPVVPTPPSRPVVKSVSISPESTSMFAGESKVFLALVKDASGNVLTGRNPRWISSDDNTATVNDTGVVACIQGQNKALVRAAVEGQEGVAEVTCLVPAPIFVFETGVSTEDRKYVQDGIAIAGAYFQKVFGRGMTRRPLTISTLVSSYRDITATAGPTTITVYAGSKGWIDAKRRSYTLPKIMIHESFHVLQYSMGFVKNNQPVWLTEGTAEYVGWKGIDDLGLFPYAKAESCALWGTRTSGVLSLRKLSEPVDVFRNASGDTYSEAMLGVDYLTLGKGVRSLLTYGLTTDAWDIGLKNVFGMTPDEFYTKFDANLATLMTPLTFECGGI